MQLYREFGHKGETRILQVIEINGLTYLLDKQGNVFERAEDFPKVTDKKIIAAVKKAAA